MTLHIAIKCTYNNGGEGVFVGFSGTCSEDIIKQNIEGGRVWCNQNDCECKQYYDNGFKGKPPVDPCYESVLFKKWQFGAGWYHTGSKAGKPIHLNEVEKGKLVVLTTRFPGEPEIDRQIIGLFKIGQVMNEEGKETMLVADQSFAIRLPMEEAKELFFWDYHSTKGGAKWGTGLVRYLDESQVSRILIDLHGTVRDEKLVGMIDAVLTKDFSGITPPPPSGPRIHISGNRARRTATARKYGPTGEGTEHKKLKEWVAKNPESIGLTNVEITSVEYLFPSGDLADIVFKLHGDRYAVAEVETKNPAPGSYQALKYRVLKCAELGIPITSTLVEAILVAWSVPEQIKEFCSNYGIRTVEKKL